MYVINREVGLKISFI